MNQDMKPEKQKSVTFSSHVVRVTIAAVVMIVAITALVLASGPPVRLASPSSSPLTWLSPPLGERPVEGIEITKPPWYFLWLFLLEETFGVRALLYAWTGLFVALALVPFIDRGPFREPRKRKIVMALMVVILVTLIALTTYGALRPAEQHIEATEEIIQSLPI